MTTFSRCIPILLILGHGTLGLGQATAVPTDRAKVADAFGKAERRLAKTPERWAPLQVGDMLMPDSAVRTGAQSAVLLVLADKHTIRVGASTQLELHELGQNRSYTFQLIEGTIWSFVNKAMKPAKYEVETPSTVLGVSGTLFHIAHERQTNRSDVSVNEGTVSLQQGAVTKTLSKGFQIRIPRGQLQQAAPQRHDKATLEMWKTIESKENWTKPNARPKIDSEVEQRVQTLKQEHESAQQKQETTKAQPAKNAPAPGPKKATPAPGKKKAARQG